MGNCVAFNNYEDIYSRIPDVGKYQRDFTCLNISEESVGLLYKVFNKIDLDHSGYISCSELFKKLQMENTKFARRIYRMYDIDKSGKIDFREFVLITWNFCTIEKDALGKIILTIHVITEWVLTEKFIFDMYDKDGQGQFLMKDVDTFVKDIYGKDFLTNQNVQR